MHQPTVEMRNAAGLNNKALLESAKVLFGLEKLISEPDYINDSSNDNTQSD